jgi:hypothetical protein
VDISISAAYGVYLRFVEIKQPDGKWVRKTNRDEPNTMFPQSWSRERIIEEIDSAWKNQKPTVMADRWKGESKSGIIIEGYKSPNPTAFPVYRKGK